MKFRAIFFDFANTLVFKRDLSSLISTILLQNGVSIPKRQIALNHKLLSEAITFPDQTTKEFYDDFNRKLLNSLGIFATRQLIDNIYFSCRKLPWVAFDDVSALRTLRAHKLGILSNWDSSLKNHLPLLSPLRFEWVLGSAESNLRKPDLAFYAKALSCISASAREILYVGDSMHLDIEPAMTVGFNAMLIDRDDFFPLAGVPRIRSLHELARIVS